MGKVLIINKVRVRRLKKDCTKSIEVVAKTLRDSGIDVIIAKEPTIRSLEKWADDGIAKTPDGCRTDCDGACVHGYPSWLVLLGVI